MGRRDVETEREEGKTRERLHLPLNRRLTIKEEATVVSSERDRDMAIVWKSKWYHKNQS